MTLPLEMTRNSQDTVVLKRTMMPLLDGRENVALHQLVPSHMRTAITVPVRTRLLQVPLRVLVGEVYTQLFHHDRFRLDLLIIDGCHERLRHHGDGTTKKEGFGLAEIGLLFLMIAVAGETNFKSILSLAQTTERGSRDEATLPRHPLLTELPTIVRKPLVEDATDRIQSHHRSPHPYRKVFAMTTNGRLPVRYPPPPLAPPLAYDACTPPEVEGAQYSTVLRNLGG